MVKFLEKLTNAMGDFATEQRGWFVLIFVLPFSVLFDVYFWLREWIVFKMYSAPDLHEKRVEDIQRQVIEFQRNNPGNAKMCTARGGWQSISPSLRAYKDKAAKVSINLYDILNFNEREKTVTVEPMVNMGQLSRFLIPKGYTLPVLPELDDLTCGGLVMGVGIETSSHKYGLFNDSIVEAEVVVASGEVVKCSRTQNRDLFESLPWSYGTLGFLTSIKLRVIPCQPFVKMWYVPTFKQKEGTAFYKACSHRRKVKETEEGKYDTDQEYFLSSAEKHEFDFVEGLMYDSNKMITMPAKWVSEKQVESAKLNRIGLWYKQWFFRHVEEYFIKPGADTKDFDMAKELLRADDVDSFLDKHFEYEYLPLRDYYHRHTKSIFWELEEIIPFGNHWAVRWFLGWALPPKVSFLKVTQTAKIKELYEKSHVIQDMMVPDKEIDSSLDVFDEQYGIYPLWICPYRAYDYSKLAAMDEKKNSPHKYFLRKPENLVAGEAFEMYVDLGAYGIPRAVKDKKPFDIVEVSRKVESFVASVHGFQMLYATSYQDRKEFREMFDHTFYDEMKARYDPDGRFPEVYQKVCKKALKLWETKK